MKRDERRLLTDLGEALDHWLHQYAPDMSAPKNVIASYEALMEAGGPLAYIAKLRQRIRAALFKRRRK